MISDPVYGYQALNVDEQRKNPSSLLQWTRNIEPLESDEDAEFPTEDELVLDALALALGDDTGCLNEEDEDFRERVDVLWLEDLLSGRM